MKLGLLIRCEKKLAELEIKGITNDSRKVDKDYAFVNTCGIAEYDTDALKNGAAVVITPNDLQKDNAIKVDNIAETFASVSANWFSNPAKELKLIGVTGTNGKTSVTYMLKAVLEKAGKKVGLIGTNQNMIGQKIIPSINTTPNAYYLNELFYEMKKDDCEYVLMEVSSHSLENGHIIGLDFEVGIFTNLTQDHLDFHGDMESYYCAKKKLFSQCKTVVLNADDQYFSRLYDDIECKKVTYSVGGTSDYIAKAVNCRATHIDYKLLTKEDLLHIDVNTGGNFTVYNSLSAIAAASQIGIDANISKEALADFGGVKGRAEVIPNTGDFTVIIDYAHTPDGLKNILKTFKSCAKERIILLFGCGGDRDKTKRGQMGEIASIYADYVIVTSDNPRTENPQEIINDIMKGIPNGFFKGKIIEDRYDAIKFALSITQKDDIIILAGKGHEDYQIIGKEKIPFNEREIIKSLLG